jgi:cell division protein FtsX
MNPFRWPRGHLLAGLIISILGGIIGLFLATILALPSGALVVGKYLPEMLSHPEWYWPYPTFGFLIAALSFYAAKILRGP